MWPKKKKPISEVEKETEEKQPEQPKETTRNAIMKLFIINNRTDAKYIFESENELGLTWKSAKSQANNVEVLGIYQNLPNDKQLIIGRFTDFSIFNTEWKTFQIE